MTIIYIIMAFFAGLYLADWANKPYRDRLEEVRTKLLQEIE